MPTESALRLRQAARGRPIDAEALVRDPLGRGLFGGAPERPADAMTEAERNEAWLRQSLETVRGLPVPEARAVVQQAREAFRYQAGPHVVLDAVDEAIAARARRENTGVEQ